MSEGEPRRVSRQDSPGTVASAPGAARRAAQRRRHPSVIPAARIRFAHPSERVFAALLDVHGIRWDYEPVEFTLRWDEEGTPAGGFRPDFWLPDLGCFVELTTADQRLVTRKNAKVRRLRELYPEVEVLVLYQRDFRELLARHGLDPSTAGAA
jgi:hypoxanthine phosphoribosyltransferase